MELSDGLEAGGKDKIMWVGAIAVVLSAGIVNFCHPL